MSEPDLNGNGLITQIGLLEPYLEYDNSEISELFKIIFGKKMTELRSIIGADKLVSIIIHPRIMEIEQALKSLEKRDSSKLLALAKKDIIQENTIANMENRKTFGSLALHLKNDINDVALYNFFEDKKNANQEFYKDVKSFFDSSTRPLYENLPQEIVKQILCKLEEEYILDNKKTDVINKKISRNEMIISARAENHVEKYLTEKDNCKDINL